MEWINQMIYGFETCGQTKLFRPKLFHSVLKANFQKTEIATTYLEEKKMLIFEIFCVSVSGYCVGKIKNVQNWFFNEILFISGHSVKY